MDKKEKYGITIFITILVLIDQIIKIICIKNGLNLSNESDTSSNGYYIMISLIIVIMLIRYINNDNSYIGKYTRIILSFGIAGAIGNVIDRLIHKEVINFIKIGNYININISYIYIIIAWVGMAAIFSKNSLKIMKEKKKVKKDDIKDVEGKS